MPVPKSRDPELARVDLEAWLRRRLDRDDVRVTRLEMPKGVGFSNETFLADATVGDRSLALVVRVAPAAYKLFPDYDLGTQRRVLEALAPTPVPVPEVLWAGDADGSPFGQEFFVMARVEGRAAEDVPPYTKRGWLFDLPPEAQREVYREGLRQLVAVAEVEWAPLGLGFLSDPRLGPPGVEQELAYWEEFLGWVLDGRREPLLRIALDELRSDRPDAGELRLSWGDSRPGNILFHDRRAVAVLDWEMACLGPREADLGWWLAYQQHQTVGHGLPELPGFPARDEAVREYEALAGVTVERLGWWERFAGFKLAVVFWRLDDMMRAVGLLPPSAPPVHATTFRLLEHLRAERRP